MALWALVMLELWHRRFVDVTQGKEVEAVQMVS